MPTAFLIFIALTPLLALEDVLLRTSRNPGYKLVLFSLLLFLVWNVLTTWWIWYATAGGAIGAFVLNSLLMTLPVFFSQKVRKRFGRTAGYAALVSFWLVFEYVHLNWEAPWPWLVLGNVFALFPDWIQWYEYTGALGGSLWIWIVNIIIYNSFIKKFFTAPYAEKPKNASSNNIKNIAFALAGIVLPIVVSFLVKPADPVLDESKNIVVVQPNIDPYEKFDKTTYEDQLRTMIQMSEQKMDDKTILVLWPETALAGTINEHEMANYLELMAIRKFLSRHPQAKLITGAVTYYVYNPGDEKSETARQYQGSDYYFDKYNTALLMDTSEKIEIYHKSKLVPLAEGIPYPDYLNFLNSLSIDLGGAIGNYGKQDSAEVFWTGNGIGAAPIICYESVFGDYVNDFVQKGANIIAIITNDGWWRDTPGHKQHLHYAVLRAIETRRFVARSANTGISCYILPTGRILQATKFWEPAVLKSGIHINNKPTFYTLYGDLIGEIAKYISFVFLFLAIFGNFIKNTRPSENLNEN